MIKCKNLFLKIVYEIIQTPFLVQINYFWYSLFSNMKKNYTIICLSIVLQLICPFDAEAQNSELSFKKISIEQGLSHSTVYCATQDRDGFLWFGTEEGLNRYDGYNFEVFRPQNNDSTTLSDATVKKIFADSKGNIWIGLNKGINRYDAETGHFERFVPQKNNLHSISNDQIDLNSYLINLKPFVEDKSGNVWVCTLGGLNYYNSSTHLFARYNHNPIEPNSLPSDTVLVVFTESENVIWFGTPSGLCKHNIRLNTFQNYTHNPNNNKTLSNNYITCILRDKQGSLWVGTRTGGLNKLITKDGKEYFEHYFEQPQTPVEKRNNAIIKILQVANGDIWGITKTFLFQGIYNPDRSVSFKVYPMKLTDEVSVLKDLTETNDGNLWLLISGKGLVKFNCASKIVSAYTYNPADDMGIPSKFINSLMIDRTNNIWLTTIKAGIAKADLNAKPFHRLIFKSGNTVNQAMNEVYSIYCSPDNKKLWIGNAAGLTEIDRATERSKYYSYIPQSSKGLAGHIVGVIQPDPEGFLWIGYFDKQLSCFYPQSGTFKHFLYSSSTPGSFPSWSLRCILPQQNKVWFGQAVDGLVCYDKEKQFFYKVIPPSNPNQLSDNWITSIVHDGQYLWLGTLKGGLNCYNLATGAVISYLHDSKIKNSISSNEVKCILQSKLNGTKYLFLGTNNGLSIFDKSIGSFKNYNITDGLPSATIHTILEDSKGHLWMGTNKGISVFDPSLETFTNYESSEGFPSDEFNVGAAFKNNNGEMFFGSGKGVVSFYPDSIGKNPIPPQVVLSSLQINRQIIAPGDTINGQIVLNKCIWRTSSLVLNARNNDFSLTFAALHYAFPKKNQYKFKLQGYDPDWIETPSSNRVASYSNLPAGNYQFRVIASNCDNVWNETGVVLDIIILPPWWKTIWFRLALLLVFIASILGFVSFRTWRLQNQKLVLLRQIESHTTELREKNKKLEDTNLQISEQKREIEEMAIQLHEADQSKLRFFMNISHELRTPLTLILGPVENMFDLVTEPVAKNLLQLVKRNSLRLLRLVNQLLDLRSLETGNMKLRLIHTDIQEYISKIFSSFNYMAQRHNVSYTFNCNTDKIETNFDPDLVDKIMYNLISNAFKYTPDGGSIEIQLSIANNQLLIAVCDSGIGIPLDKQNYIFNRFYRIEGPATRKESGTGIGLSLAYEMAQLHNGKLTVNSEPGKGSVFTFTLPLDLKGEIVSENIFLEGVSKYPHITADIENEELFIGVRQNKPDEETERNLPLMLIVDDNPDIISFLNMMFNSSFNVLLASNGKDGLNLAREYVPDIIIADVMMPVMSGLEMCRTLKVDEQTSHIPVIMLTARVEDEQQLEGLETGADDYIIKPFNPSLLKRRITNLLESREKLRTQFTSEPEKDIAKLATNKTDKGFLEKLSNAIETQMDNPNLDGDLLAKTLGMSKSSIYKKVNALANVSINIFIRNLRLRKALEILKNSDMNISEVAFRVGFSDHSYFTKCFSEYFGFPPSKIL